MADMRKGSGGSADIHVYETSPGRAVERARDVSDEFLPPQDRFTEEERARPRLDWLRPNSSRSRDAYPKRRPVLHARPSPAEAESRRLDAGQRFRARAAGHPGSAFDTSYRLGGWSASEGPVFIEQVSDIVSAYVANNSVPVTELPVLLAEIHAALTELAAPAPAAETADKPTPAQVRKSITPEALISFIDGKPYKTLKRHLSRNGLTIEQYRERYGLPRDYPSTAASYSAQRSELARSLGLGQQRRKAPAAAAPEPEAAGASPASGKSKRATRARHHEWT